VRSVDRRDHSLNVCGLENDTHGSQSYSKRRQAESGLGSAAAPHGSDRRGTGNAGPTNAPSTGLAALHVPAGFKVEKAAGADLLSYPMMGTFDDRGRLYLCESSGNTLTTPEMVRSPITSSACWKTRTATACLTAARFSPTS